MPKGEEEEMNEPRVGMVLNLNDGEERVTIKSIRDGFILFSDKTWIMAHEWEGLVRDGAIRIVR